MIRNDINHIIKPKFLPAIKVAIDVIFISNNIKGDFRNARVISFNPEAVITKLDI